MNHVTCRAVLLSCLTVLLAACAGDRFEYTPVGEMDDGPGMFTGESGEAVFSLRREPGTASHDGGAEGDYEEFLEYSAFREWQNDPERADEHREFRLWQEWREQRSER